MRRVPFGAAGISALGASPNCSRNGHSYSLTNRGHEPARS